MDFKYLKSYNRYGNFKKRLKGLFFLNFQQLPLFAVHYQRPCIVKMGGVKIEDPYHTFIGEGVIFDTVHPEMIVIATGVRIIMRSIVLTHYFNPATGHYTIGHSLELERLL